MCLLEKGSTTINLNLTVGDWLRQISGRIFDAMDADLLSARMWVTGLEVALCLLLQRISLARVQECGTIAPLKSTAAQLEVLDKNVSYRSLFQNSGQLDLRAQLSYLVIIFSVSTLRDSFGFAAESRPESTKYPFKASGHAQTFHASDMSVLPALCRQSGGGLVWLVWKTD